MASHTTKLAARAFGVGERHLRAIDRDLDVVSNSRRAGGSDVVRTMISSNCSPIQNRPRRRAHATNILLGLTV